MAQDINLFLDSCFRRNESSVQHLILQCNNETVKKPTSDRLTENVQMQVELAKSRSLIDPTRGTGASETGDPPEKWGVQAKRGQIPRNQAYIEVRRSDLPC